MGKTWLMNEFERIIIIAMFISTLMKKITQVYFEVNKNPYRIIELLSMIAGEKIIPGETLVILLTKSRNVRKH